MTRIPPEPPKIPKAGVKTSSLETGVQQPYLISDANNKIFDSTSERSTSGRARITQPEENYTFNARDFLNDKAISHMQKPCQMQRDIPEISRIISFALTKEPPWISTNELEEIENRLRSAENSADTYRLLHFVQARAIDPLDKKPEEVNITPDSISELEMHFANLCESNGRQLRDSEYSLYATLEDGRSILFFNRESSIVSTALTRKEFNAILASIDDQTTKNFFLNLFDLPPLTEADFSKSKEMKEERKEEEKIVAFFKNKPKPNQAQKSLDPKRRNYEVFQGNGFGVVKSLDTTDSLSTFGLGPCVCFMVHEGNKGLMVHIDDFSGKSSLTQTGTEQFLDRHINEFSSQAKIHIQGANENAGRKTVIEIYKYLERHGLLEQISTANVLNQMDGHSAVVLDLRTGELHPSN